MTVTLNLLTFWLIFCSVEDIRQKQIHLILLLFGVSLCFISMRIDTRLLLRYRLLGILPGFVILLFSIVTKEAIGKADGIMVLVIGGCIGIDQTVLVLLISSMLCACFSVIVLMLRVVRCKDKLPFAPFLLAGVWGMFFLYG